MSFWVSYNIDNLSDIKPLPATYVIYSDKGLIYIGQASNAKLRLGSYKIRPASYSNGVFHSIKDPEVYSKHILVKVFYSRRMGDWAMREIRLIKRLKPLLNNTHGGQKKRAKPIKRNKDGQEIVYIERPSERDLMLDIMAERAVEDEKMREIYMDMQFEEMMKQDRADQRYLRQLRKKGMVIDVD